MFASVQLEDEGSVPSGPDASSVRVMLAGLSTATGPVGTGAQIDAERIDLIRALED